MRVPFYRVRSDGVVDALGDYDAGRRALRLTCRGYPLAQAGEHIAPGALPWVFFDMLPSGFLGRRFAHAFAPLRLPPDASRWNTDQALRALCEAGHDLAGDLLLGDETLRRFERIWGGSLTPGPSRDEAPGHFARFVDDTLDAADGLSSLGGERPKFSLRLDDGSAWLVKFSPPLTSEAGRRWADILRVELHAAETARAHGLDAARGFVLERSNRAFLVLERFDRVAGKGAARRGDVVLARLGALRHGRSPRDRRRAPRRRRALRRRPRALRARARLRRRHGERRRPRGQLRAGLRRRRRRAPRAAL